MTVLVAIYLYALSAFLLFMMLRQFIRGESDLLSIRNFIVLGFIVFQLIGAAGAVLVGGASVFILTTPGWTSFIYAVMATIFLAVFFVTYRRSSVATWLARATPATRAVPSEPALWMLASVLLVVAAVLRFGPSTGLVHNVTSIAGISVAAAACGIAGWLWSRRFLNPAVLIAAAVICVAAATITMTGAFGRRGLVALGASMLWGMYYSNLRYMMPRPALTRLAIVAAFPLVFVALFSSVRDAGEHGRTAREHLEAIRANADITAGLGLLFRGQDSGTNSLWLLEQYPGGDFETRPLFTLFYLGVYMVPRDWWPNKPEPLSTLLPHMAGVHGVNRERLKLGPGIIGHAAAEGGIFALLIYAMVAGLFIRYLEELVRNNLWSPLTVVAIGSTFGQLIGMPRGETAAFTALFLIGIVSTYLIMLTIGKMIESMTGSGSITYMPPDVIEQFAEEYEYAEHVAPERQFLDEPKAM